MLGQRFFQRGNKTLQPVQGSLMMPQQYVAAPQQPMMVMQPGQVMQQPVQMPMQMVPAGYQQAVPMQPAPAVQQPTMQQPTPGDVDPNAVLNSSMDPTKREGLDILTHLSQRSSQAIFKAANQATQQKVPYIDTEHVLYGLLFDGQLFNFLKEARVDPITIQKEVESHFEPGNFAGQPQFSPRVKRVLELAYSTSRSINAAFVAPEHLLVGLIEEGEGIAALVLRKVGLDAQKLKTMLATQEQSKTMVGAKGQKESALADFTQDITAKAKEGKLDPVIGRSTEIERAIHILSRRTKNNPALIGEAGTGKTAIVEGLAQRIVSGSVPQDLAHKRILSLDLMALVAGASKRGEFEDRLKHIIKELQMSTGQIILFIDEMHNIIGAGGGEGTMDAGNILKPYLARGEIQVIGTDTIDEYRKYIEKDPALERRFQPVLVPEPSVEDAIAMIKGIRDKYEAFHKVKISDQAVEAAVKLSSRYIGDRFLPDKAVDLIDEAASLKRLPAISLPEEIKTLQTQLLHIQQEKADAEKANNKGKLVQAQKDLETANGHLTELVQKFEKQRGSTTNVVEEGEIEQIVSQWTNIPITRLTESESEKLLHLEDKIHQRLIDQQGAVNAVAEAVRRGRAGLKASKRPIGSFLFLGPTGTGKTELAKTLAEALFGSEDLMIRLDMTEYMEKHEVAKLIGAPPGYVGYEEGGQLTEAVRRKPYSVVLLDEVEKAHPDVFNILIQILEDGRLTDNKGHTISFKNTILICTSNLGSNLIQAEDLGDVTVQNIQAAGGADSRAASEAAAAKAKASGKAATANEKFAALTKKLMDELKKFFRPELLNRFDEIIVFKPISRADMVKITEIQLAGTQKLLQEQNLSIEVSDSAKKHLAEIGYDPVYGARPLRRLIQQQIENSISTLIIKQEVKEGDTVLVNFQNGQFVFSKKQQENANASGQANAKQTPQILSTAVAPASATQTASTAKGGPGTQNNKPAPLNGTAAHGVAMATAEALSQAGQPTPAQQKPDELGSPAPVQAEIDELAKTAQSSPSTETPTVQSPPEQPTSQPVTEPVPPSPASAPPDATKADDSQAQPVSTVGTSSVSNVIPAPTDDKPQAAPQEKPSEDLNSPAKPDITASSPTDTSPKAEEPLSTPPTTTGSQEPTMPSASESAIPTSVAASPDAAKPDDDKSKAFFENQKRFLDQMADGPKPQDDGTAKQPATGGADTITLDDAKPQTS